MKTVTFKHLIIRNFCNFPLLDVDLFDKTKVSGRNGSGKTTIQNAILWLFTDKLLDGSSAGDTIRPHEADGTPINFIDISVCLTVEVDGEEFELTKTQKQKWVTKRGSEEKKYEGNENIYEVSGVPKGNKEFNDFIREVICDPDSLGIYLNANTFFSLDTKKRREKLFELVEGVSNEDILNNHPEYSELRTELKVGKVEEIQKKFTKAISESKKKLEAIPARIDEVQRSIVQIDVAEMELAKKAKMEELAEVVKAISEKQSEEEALEADCNMIESSLNHKALEAKDKCLAEKESINDLISELKSKRLEITNKRQDLNFKLDRSIAQKANIYIPSEDDIVNAEGTTMDENSLYCPLCKQIYPEEKQGEIKANFQATKEQKISGLKAKREQGLKDYEAEKNKQAELKAELEKLNTVQAEIDEKITALESKKSVISYEKILEEDAEYADLKQALRVKQLKLEEFDEGDLPARKIAIEVELAAINDRFLQSKENDKREERIEELKAEQRQIAQTIANQERLRDLLDSFNRTKMKMVTDCVNKYFSMIEWVLFAPQINGGYKDVCRATVKGSDIEGLLNNSDRLLAKADICKAFQSATRMCMPIMIDDAESINASRIPDVDNQLLIMQVTEDELRVESL